MAQDSPGPHRRIYLLTIWQERSRDPQTSVQWRFTLAHPATGQRRGFASLEALVTALHRITSGAEDLARKEAQDDIFDD